MKFIKQNGCGILLCAAIAAAATFLSGLKFGGFSMSLIGAPVISILTGMIISLAAPKFAHHGLIAGGVKFSSKKYCNGQSSYSASRWISALSHRSAAKASLSFSRLSRYRLSSAFS